MVKYYAVFGREGNIEEVGKEEPGHNVYLESIGRGVVVRPIPREKYLECREREGVVVLG